MCAAAALAVGLGQAAEAATYNVDFTITRAEHIYFPLDEDDVYEVTPLAEWMGLAVSVPLRGILDIMSNGLLTLDVSGVRVFASLFGPDTEPDGSLTWLQMDHETFSLNWTGSSGVFSYVLDNLPDYEQVDATLELAPVPLPATAALLPMGIGALALMRKRRRPA